MDIILLILAVLAILIGIAGCFLPVLPGPPIAWLGLLLLDFTKYAEFSLTLLITTAIITVLITLFDFFLPSLATRKFGGSKAGERGAFAGTLVGIFLGPPGIILGPFIGALLGEIISDPSNTQGALRAAIGSFMGFILSTGIKLIWCIMLAWWFVRAII